MKKKTKKLNKRDQADQIYNHILKTEIKPLLGFKATYLDQLDNVCNKLFGRKYRGTFPSDQIPKLNDVKKYCILNLDRSDQAGSHWIALAKDDNKTYLYDSFGRAGNKIIPNLEFSGNGKIIDVDRDAEQGILEENCGARCVGFLCVFDRYGANVAKYV